MSLIIWRRMRGVIPEMGTTVGGVSSCGNLLTGSRKKAAQVNFLNWLQCGSDNT
jgi:hypothetical protein